jgi:succinyl-CoA synthetase beta subunit
MNLHEYQAKHLLATYGMPVPKNEVAWNTEQARDAAHNIGGNRWVVKAQIHAGGRGKAGGVRLVSNIEELERAVKELLGTRLVTYQTDNRGLPVNQVLIEQPSNIAREIYLSALIDRAKRRLIIMASTEGGVEIEKIAETHPEKIIRIVVDPLVGVQPFQCRELGFALKLKSEQIKQLTNILTNLYKMYNERDLSLVEINPLVVTKEGNLLCLDAKINVDDNALYRQTQLREWRDTAQEDE